MHVPDEFLQFCMALDQDYDIYGPEPEDWIKGALGYVRRERYMVFRDYLNELLSGKYSDAQLSELYHSTSPELRFRDANELRQFLEMTRDTLDENLRPGAPDSIDLARQALLQRLRDAE